jgi:DNA-binding NarL/FixJ family response regulator
MNPIPILLVDDSPLFLEIATDFLGQYEELALIGTASSGQEALAQVEELHPQVVLLDLGLPDLPGLEVIPRLRHLQPQVGIIVVTLLEINSYQEAVLTAGANALISKTHLELKLLPAIRWVVQETAQLWPEIEENLAKQVEETRQNDGAEPNQKQSSIDKRSDRTTPTSGPLETTAIP